MTGGPRKSKLLTVCLLLYVCLVCVHVFTTSSDGNGTLDLAEFKTLAKQLIETAKEVKDDINKKKQLQVKPMQKLAQL